jgi:trans-aconitate methyltransferase
VIAHWDAVYDARPPDAMSWYQREPTTSLRLLGEAAPPPGSVIDVGAGASTLADHLLAHGWSDVTLLDVSESGLAETRARLADPAPVTFVVADVLTWQPNRTYNAWHDRAVFHFLTEERDRELYVARAAAAVRPGGVAVIGTFAAQGPTQCSGLPTARYGADELAAVFAPAFALEQAESEEHVTPAGVVQPFTWVVLRR